MCGAVRQLVQCASGARASELEARECERRRGRMSDYAFVTVCHCNHDHFNIAPDVVLSEGVRFG